MRRLPALTAVLVAVALAASACGGAKSGPKKVSATEADQAYITAGNQVCIRSDKRIFAIGRLTRDPKGWARTAAAARIAVREMRKVKPTPARAEAFAQMLKYASALTLAVSEVQIALVKGKVDTAAAAQFAAAQIQDKVHESAKAAGLTFCQQVLTNWPA